MLNRRLMMAQKKAGPPPEDWDDEWDYTDGLAENYFMKLEEGTPTMTAEGELLEYSTEIVRLVNKTETISSGVVECTVSAQHFSPLSPGTRIMLSNGTGGVQVYIKGTQRAQGLYCQIKDAPAANAQKIADMVSGRDYVIKLVFTGTGINEIYLDGVKIHEEPDSMGYNRRNQIMQQNGGATVLKSLKYKYNRI